MGMSQMVRAATHPSGVVRAQTTRRNAEHANIRHTQTIDRRLHRHTPQVFLSEGWWLGPGFQDMSLEKPALNDLIPMVGRPTSGRGGGGAMGRSSRLGDSQLTSTGGSAGGAAGAAGGVSAGQARMAAVRELQEENASLREKLADIQVRI